MTAAELGNPWDAIRRAVDESKNLDRAVSASCADMASLLAGNLRRVSKNDTGAHLLRTLKRELRDFDMTTGTWRTKT